MHESVAIIPGGVPTAMITAWYIVREILNKENLA
jgi:hypothetical protein